MRCIREAELWYTKDPHSQMGKVQMVRQLQLQSFSTKKKGSETHIKLPRLGVLHQEDKHPECSALKTRKT